MALDKTDKDRIPKDISDLLEVFIVTHLANPTFRNLNYVLALDELNHHYHALRRSSDAPHINICISRCNKLYQRCMRSATTYDQRLICQELYNKVLDLHRESARSSQA